MIQGERVTEPRPVTCLAPAAVSAQTFPIVPLVDRSRILEPSACCRVSLPVYVIVIASSVPAIIGGTCALAFSNMLESIVTPLVALGTIGQGGMSTGPVGTVKFMLRAGSMFSGGVKVRAGSMFSGKFIPKDLSIANIDCTIAAAPGAIFSGVMSHFAPQAGQLMVTGGNTIGTGSPMNVCWLRNVKVS